ncbi:MAG TPA: hypothetical protein PKA63_10295 [Oligoflexia bacterium]|nr:hypothetical protein [Oligoflexia bacterium]HMP49047.1 hypothetical protein [Oligoflexia bacterium]
MGDTSDSLLWVSLGNDPLSPGFYMGSLLEPYVKNFSKTNFNQKNTINNHKGVIVLNLEDSSNLKNFLNELDFFRDLTAHTLIVIFHDSDFYESTLPQFSFHGKVIRFYPWAHFMKNQGEGDISPESLSFLFPYPWSGNELCLGFSSEDESDLRVIQSSPILINIRGYREGRLFVLGKVLKKMKLTSRTILLSMSEEREYFTKYLSHFGLNDLCIYSPSRISSLLKLIRKSSLIINPCVSSVRPLSILLMEAFYNKIPVLLSDFGSAKSLPSLCRKYAVSPYGDVAEEKALEEAISEILADQSRFKTDSVESHLREYALEYGDPTALSNEILNLIRD